MQPITSFVPVSGNAKTGPIPVTYSPSTTCPDACKLKGNGCYAEGGNVALHWRKVEQRGVSFESFLTLVRHLPKGQLWRHNVAGDLPGKNNRIAPKALRKLAEANKGRRGFTFTHKPLTPTNARAIREANEGGFTVNLSADGLEEADRKTKAKVGPVVVVLPSDAPDKGNVTPEGRHVTVCPAQLREEITCARCGLCAKADRKTIVGFRAHGVWTRRVNERLHLSVVN
jgi:hypothetical protein